MKCRDEISHPCFNFYVGLAKPLLSLGMSIYTLQKTMDVINYPLLNLY